MRKIIKIYFLTILFVMAALSVYPVNENNIKSEIKNIFENYEFYYCEKNDLDLLLKKKYLDIRIIHNYHFSGMTLNEKEDIIEMVNNVSFWGINECKYIKDNDKIIVNGFYIGPGEDYKNSPKKNVKLEIYKKHAVFYDLDNNNIQYFIKWKKGIGIYKFLLNNYKSEIYNNNKNYDTANFKWDISKFYLKNKEYKYQIYPVLFYKNKDVKLIEDYYFVEIYDSSYNPVYDEPIDLLIIYKTKIKKNKIIYDNCNSGSKQIRINNIYYYLNYDGKVSGKYKYIYVLEKNNN